METFLTKIRPSFDNFLRSPNIEHLRKFRKNLDDLSKSDFKNSALEQIMSMLMAPLVAKIDDLSLGKNLEMTTELIITLKNLIKLTKIRDENGLKTIIIITLREIHDFQTGCIKLNLSEEIKLAVVECISEAFKCSFLEVLEKFYCQNNCTFIGKIAVTCVDLIEKEKYRKLRNAAVNCLQALFYVGEGADFTDFILRSQIADITFVFLPKILQVLLKISIENEKIGERLITDGIKTLSQIICIIFEDDLSTIAEKRINNQDFFKLIEDFKSLESSTDKEILYNENKSKSQEENFKSLVEKGRTLEWFRASSLKIRSIFLKLVQLRSNLTDGIRYEYAQMCCTLAEKCPKNLQVENFVIFLESIIALSQDSSSRISSLCIRTIENLTKSNTEIYINTIIVDLFELHLTQLPRIIERSEKSEQLSEFLFLKGFFNLLPEESLTQIFHIPRNIHFFLLNLISIFELELNQNLLMEEYALRAIDENADNIKFDWRNLKKTASQDIIKILGDICNRIGKITSLVMNITDNLMKFIRKDQFAVNESILILMSMLAQEQISENLSNLFIEELLEDIHWHLELRPDSIQRLKVEKPSYYFVDKTPGLYESAIEIRTQDIDLDEDDEPEPDIVNIIDVKFNVLHTCLVLDSIGHMALALREKFKPYIFKSLHKVLQKTASSNYMIHKSGSFALNSIKKSLNLTKVSDLIENYSDYISYHINISLKKNNKSHIAVDILSVVLRYGSKNSISHLENIITTILDELTKISNIQLDSTNSYLKVFNIFLMNAKLWSKETEKILDSQVNYDDNEHLEDLYGNFVQIFEKTTNDGILNADNSDVGGDNDNFEKEEMDQDLYQDQTKKEIPKYIQLILRILKETLKFISSKNKMQQVAALDCSITGLPILIDYEDELLPLVHLIWQPFSERFKQDDPIVLNRCFSLLEVLAKCAKTFLLKSTLDDILPFLNKFLQTSSINSTKETSLSQTQEFKLQLKLLENYSSLIINLEVKQKHLDHFLNSVLLYLDEKQPKLLQESCIKSLINLINYNKPLIVLKLLDLRKKSNFCKNISFLFKELNIK